MIPGMIKYVSDIHDKDVNIWNDFSSQAIHFSTSCLSYGSGVYCTGQLSVLFVVVVYMYITTILYTSIYERYLSMFFY